MFFHIFNKKNYKFYAAIMVIVSINKLSLTCYDERCSSRFSKRNLLYVVLMLVICTVVVHTAAALTRQTLILL